MNSKYLLLAFLILTCAQLSAKQRDTSQLEWIKAYFNTPSDHSYALEGNTSNDNWDMIGELVKLINQAQYSVDLVAYDLQNMRVGHALANAARRGLQVRVITDVIHRNHATRFVLPMWDTLRAAGIISFDDSGAIYWPDGRIESLPKKLPNSGANMHHKFCVIDGLSDDPNDDFLWTGTMNITYTGPWNTNAILVIKDSGISAAYLKEFQQMWGSKKATPNANLARFHKDKLNVSNNIHYINSIRVEVYFGPLDRDKTKPSISERVTELITYYAKHDARFLAFAISSDIPLSQALLDRSARGELILHGVIDPAFFARYRNNGDVWARPESQFGNRYITAGKEMRKLHSKTLLLDVTYPYPEKHKAVTITGSYNFSKAAELANDENILIIFDNNIANQYYQDFMGVMSRAKGESFHQYPTVNVDTTYDRCRVIDGQLLEVELTTNVFYPVSLLGISAPREWGGHRDSTYFYSAEAKAELKKLVADKKIIITGPEREIPEHKFGRYYAYVLAIDSSGNVTHVNREMLLAGAARHSDYARHSQDSVVAFRKYIEEAEFQGVGMWSQPDSLGMRVQTEKAAMLEDLYPLNLNIATQQEIELIPSIGPGRASSIIAYRQENGSFGAVEDLLKIKGIGPATLEKLRQFVTVSEEE